jgi:hypothetical protein
MTGIVTSGFNNGRKTLLCDRQKVMTVTGSFDGVHGNSHTTIGTVFETNRTGETRG